MTYDFAPLFRTAIGFDRLARLVDTAAEAAAPQPTRLTTSKRPARTPIA